MLKKLSELIAKFPATMSGCSMVKIALLDDAFSEDFLTASKLSRRSITAAERKEKERKEKNSKSENPKGFLVQISQNFDFCPCPSQNVVKRDASSKMGKLLCLQMPFGPD